MFTAWESLNYYGFFLCAEQQKTDSQHFPSRPFIQRRPGPPTMVPSKNHVTNPLTNQLASINALFNSTQSQALLQGHSHSTPSTTASGSSGNSNSATRSSMNEMSGHSNVGPGSTHGTKLFITLIDLILGRDVACGFYLVDVTEDFFYVLIRFTFALGRIWWVLGAGRLPRGGGNDIGGRCNGRYH